MDVPFYQLNLIDEYNLGMGNVDQADQLRLQYRIHYWLHNQKWCFAIFFWCYELSLTNCYVLYRHFFKIHDKAPPYSHYEFIREIEHGEIPLRIGLNLHQRECLIKILQLQVQEQER